MDKKDTVMMDDERRSSSVGIGIAVALLILAVLFFLFGGLSMLNDSTQNGTTDTPTTPTTQTPVY